MNANVNLENIKSVVEGFPKKHQIEILKLIKHHSNVTINENKSGIYINLAFLSEKTLTMIQKYIDYVQDQESLLKPVECQKQTFKETFFIEKEHKDTAVI
jgi:hypothetical protein